MAETTGRRGRRGAARAVACGTGSTGSPSTTPIRGPVAWRGSGAGPPPAPIGSEAGSLSLTAVARRGSWRVPAATLLGLVAGLILVPFDWILAGTVQQTLVSHVPLAALRPALIEAAILLGGRAALLGSGEILAGFGAARATSDLRRSLFSAMLRHRPDWMAARPAGGLAAAIGDQVSSIDGYLARYLPSMVQAVVLPIVFGAAVAAVDPIAGALLLVTAPLVPVFMALVGSGAQAAQERHQQSFQRLSGLFADRLRGLPTLKLLGRATDEADRLRRVGEELRSRTAEVLRIAFLSSAVLEFFAALGVAGVALYVGLTYLGFLHLRWSPLSLQGGLFCLLLAPEVYQPLRQFAANYHDRAAAKAAISLLAETFGPLSPAPPEAAVEAATSTERGAVAISATALSIETPDRSRLVLRGARLEVPAGLHVAVMGASGSGKSTLVETLAGLRAYCGDLRFEGRSLSSMPDAELRARTAVLVQRPHIFRGTLADNIRFGREGASQDEVRAAAIRAGVMRFAEALPEGLDAPVGDGGIGCSGGEAQRIALARIYLRDPGLILLDEPTAHLDRDTEALVLDGLLSFASGRTLIVATHSPAVAARMRRVFRIEARSLLPALHRPAPGRRQPIGCVR